jgi:hypothetical protein
VLQVHTEEFVDDDVAPDTHVAQVVPDTKLPDGQLQTLDEELQVQVEYVPEHVQELDPAVDVDPVTQEIHYYIVLLTYVLVGQAHTVLVASHIPPPV